jgi:hypothetical protein
VYFGLGEDGSGVLVEWDRLSQRTITKLMDMVVQGHELVESVPGLVPELKTDDDWDELAKDMKVRMEPELERRTG